MSRLQYPKIAPLPEGTPRPFWSVMIPAYNRTKYLERTLRCVLEQAPGPEEMQIQVVDNASPTDDVENLVRRLGGSRVEFFRQQQNLGMVGNWNTCVERARGQWVHILHDDDLLRPDFYKTYQQFIEAHPSVGMVFSRSIIIDEDDEWQELLAAPPRQKCSGMMDDALFRLVTDNPGAYLRCPAVVVARRAYEKASGFDSKAILTVDWQMWMRVAAQVDVGYLSQPLALYRVHQNSTTNDLAVRHNLALDFERSLRCGIALLPHARRAEAWQKSRSLLTANVMWLRNQMLDLQRPDAALRYSRYVYHIQRSPVYAAFVFKDIVRAITQKFLYRTEQVQ